MRSRELYLTLRGIQSLKDTELESRSRISRSLSRRLWLWRRGFLARSDALYDLTEESASSYVSDYQRSVKTRQINGTWSFALKNKLMFHWLMQPFDRHRMAIHGVIRDEQFHLIDGEVPVPLLAAGDGGNERGPANADHRPRDCAAVLDRLESESKLVLKWIHGGGGNNVLVCAYNDGEYRINREVCDRQECLSRFRELQDYLVCEFVDQDARSAGLYPHAPNTIRILTMYDAERGQPYVPAAVHRIGTEKSRPMDNFLQGGLSASIDLESGKLGAAAQLPYSGELEWHEVHPDTEVQIAGTRVPAWSRILDRVREIASLHAYIPYVGWDLIVTDDRGAFTVIEANSYPGLHSVQVHHPLLADDRVRDFYREHGVL